MSTAYALDPARERRRAGAAARARRAAQRRHAASSCRAATCRWSPSRPSCAAARSAIRAATPSECVAGVASLVAGLLEKGAGERDAFAFADAVEGAGGNFSVTPGAEALSISGQYLARDQHLMIELLADALIRPRFDAERAREAARSAHRADQGDQGLGPGRAHRRLRARAALRRASVRAADRRQRGVARGHHAASTCSRTTPITSARIASFSSWPATSTCPRSGARCRTRSAIGAVPACRSRARRSPSARRAVACCWWIRPNPRRPISGSRNVGVNKQYPHHAALDLVNTLYGGRFTSMLNTELRIKSGLSYSARAGFFRGTVAGEFAIRSFTDTANTRKALDLSLDTLARLKRDGVTSEMLDSARAVRAGPVSARLRDGGGLGRRAGGARVLRARRDVHR